MNLRSIRLWRRLCQTGAAFACLLVPLLNKAGLHQVSGNFLSFHVFGLPAVDPLAALQVALVTFSLPTHAVVGAGLVLALCLLLGPIFCSWICPYGLLSELLLGVSRRRFLTHQQQVNDPPALPLRFFGALPDPTAIWRHGGNDAPRQGAGQSLALWGKAVLAVVGAALAWVLSEPVLNQLSMPGWYSRALQYGVLYREFLWGAGAMCAVLVLEALWGRRFWCRWFCPQSLLPALAGLLFPRRFGLRFRRGGCTCLSGAEACRLSCTLGLDPRVQKWPLRLQCSNCGDCVDACSARGKVLHFGFAATRKKR